jgi:hypothetical protein
MSLTATIKSIQNEMRKDEGVGGDDQRIEQHRTPNIERRMEEN